MMMVLEEKQLNRFHLCSEATTPIREQGARMTQMLEPNPTWPQPTDELDTEIKEDQVQLSNLKRQRGLLSSNDRLLMRSRERLRWPGTGSRLPPAKITRPLPVLLRRTRSAHNTGGLAALVQTGDRKAGIIRAPNDTLPAPFEQAVSPSFRTPQLNLSLVKPEKTDSN
ncbi:unnamed protein product, partial [Penicillium palitans]